MVSCVSVAPRGVARARLVAGGARARLPLSDSLKRESSRSNESAIRLTDAGSGVGWAGGGGSAHDAGADRTYEWRHLRRDSLFRSAKCKVAFGLAISGARSRGG